MLNKIIDKREAGSTLKILGRVILSCQFKSGPGHQSTTPNITETQSWRGFKRLPRISHFAFLARYNKDIYGHLGTPSDASMMREPRFGHLEIGNDCLVNRQLSGSAPCAS